MWCTQPADSTLYKIIIIKFYFKNNVGAGCLFACAVHIPKEGRYTRLLARRDYYTSGHPPFSTGRNAFRNGAAISSLDIGSIPCDSFPTNV